MKVTRSVKHHINMGNYEWTEIEASIEADVPDKLTPDITKQIDGTLEKLIRSDLAEAVRLGDDDSYITQWRD